jgi:hypothetical protein
LEVPKVLNITHELVTLDEHRISPRPNTIQLCAPFHIQEKLYEKQGIAIFLSLKVYFSHHIRQASAGTRKYVDGTSRAYGDVRKEGTMRDNEKWMELCEQAAKEQDPEKFMALVQEIEALLQQREEQFEEPRVGPSF